MRLVHCNFMLRTVMLQIEIFFHVLYAFSWLSVSRRLIKFEREGWIWSISLLSGLGVWNTNIRASLGEWSRVFIVPSDKIGLSGASASHLSGIDHSLRVSVSLSLDLLVVLDVRSSLVVKLFLLAGDIGKYDVALVFVLENVVSVFVSLRSFDLLYAFLRC